MVCLPSDFWPPQKWVPQAERNVRRKRGVSSQIPQLQFLLPSSHEKNAKKVYEVKTVENHAFVTLNVLMPYVSCQKDIRVDRRNMTPRYYYSKPENHSYHLRVGAQP